MADALISPAVGGTMWLATAGVLSYSITKIKNTMDDRKVPLMGVMGAFVFAAQMINFTIPGTGSSGHIGGGMLLSILLGPYAGFLTLTSILLIQALFFADGGLLSFGCNVINMGLFTCFFAYPYIYKRIMRKGYSKKRLIWAIVISAVIGLQLGAFSVTVETLLSGKTELPFVTFVALMQPIHLAIGLIEGIVTAAVISFIYNASPELLYQSSLTNNKSGLSPKKVIAILAIVALVTGGFFSWFASSNPDGLEWSTTKVAGQDGLKSPEGIHKTFAEIQEKIAFLPDYNFKNRTKNEEQSKKPLVSENSGTSVSGIIGGVLTLIIAGLTGFFVNLYKKKHRKST